MNKKLVSDSDNLAKLCDRLSLSQDLALDTEFMRVSSFFPRLALVQISDGETTIAIDMLSEIDFSPLEKLLQNPSIRKSIHASRQDLEVLHHRFGKNPVNILDTQIACQFIGFEQPPSYESIIQFFLGENIDKKLQLCDWLERPLSQDKLNYALNDVQYLAQVIEKIIDELNKRGRMEWLLEECQILEKNISFTASIEELLNRLARHFTTQKQFVKALAALRWREELAMKRDVIRRYIISDDEIILLVNRGILYAKANRLMTLEAKAKINDPHVTEEDAQLIERVIKRKSLRTLEKNSRYKELALLLTEVAEREQIQASLIAPTDELLKYAHSLSNAVRFMSGWRYKIFGRLLSDKERPGI